MNSPSAAHRKDNGGMRMGASKVKMLKSGDSLTVFAHKLSRRDAG